MPLCPPAPCSQLRQNACGHDATAVGQRGRASGRANLPELRATTLHERDAAADAVRSDAAVAALALDEPQHDEQGTDADRGG